jgi:tripartite-type tricarboxylate transporter receptor subunit TctC
VNKRSVDRVRRFILGVAVALTACSFPVFAQSNNYPSKPVRIVVPSSPGGSLDTVARLIGVKLGEIWGQPVIVENKAGGEFAVGATYVARSPADGYTLLYAHDALLAINPALNEKLAYDPLKDFTPVGRVVDLPLVLYVRRDLPQATVPALLQALRAEPDKFNHASGGSSTFMSSQLFKAVAEVKYTDVPYKGASPAITAVASGEADFAFADTGSANALLQAGRIRAMATAGPRRLKSQPTLPAIAETLPGFSNASWSGLHAPAGTPTPVLQKISTDLRTVLAMPDVLSRLQDLGLEVNYSTPQELSQQIQADAKKWMKLAKDRKLRAQ